MSVRLLSTTTLSPLDDTMIRTPDISTANSGPSCINETCTYYYSDSVLRHEPVSGPNGRRIIRRVTGRSSTYGFMASLWVLGAFCILWLVRDLFYLLQSLERSRLGYTTKGRNTRCQIGKHHMKGAPIWPSALPMLRKALWRH